MNNVEKVKAGELIVHNDDKEALKKVASYFEQSDWKTLKGTGDFYVLKNSNNWVVTSKKGDPIPATVLLSEIEGKTQLTKEEAVRQIKVSELAIENNDLEASAKCCMNIWPKDVSSSKGGVCTTKFIFQDSHRNDYWTHNPTIDGYILYNKSIPATELLKLLESETAWSPKVGEMVEARDNEGKVWNKGKLLAIINHEYKYVVMAHGSNQPFCFKNCRHIPKQLTRTEAEALLSELKGETYKIVN